jgi:ABC-2 type transport system permease protein
MALCATSLGIFIAAIARSEAQISGMSNAILWIAGFLGGALMPIFIIQRFPFLNFLSRLVPQTWANMAYYDILARGKSLEDIVPYLGILVLFTLVFAVVGIRKFRYE